MSGHATASGPRSALLLFLNKALQIGTADKPDEETRYIRIVNLISLLAVPLTAINTLVNLSISPTLFIGVQAILALLYASTFVWNQFNFYSVAKVWLSCVFLVDIAFTSTLIFGASSDAQWQLMLAIPLAFLIWSNKQYFMHYLTIAVSFILFALIVQYDGPSLVQLTRAQQKIMALSSFINVVIISGFAYYLFVRDNDTYRKKLHYFASYDALTGLLNRREFENTVNKKISAIPENQTCAFMLLDCDDFKKINDKYGHVVGDQALIYLATLLHKTEQLHKAEDAVVGRLGGDEFCIFFEDANVSYVETFVVSLFKELKETPFLVDQQPIYISISIGITLESQRRDTDRIFASADDAMYEAKRSGKGTYHINQA